MALRATKNNEDAVQITYV